MLLGHQKASRRQFRRLAAVIDLSVADCRAFPLPPDLESSIMMLRSAVLTCLLLALPAEADAQGAGAKPGAQVETSLRTSDDAEVGYLIYLPKDYEEQVKVPLMLFLHGRGESNGPLSLVAKWGPPRFAARGDELNYVLVSPQCPREDSWSSDVQQARLVELLDEIIQSYKVDEDQVFLTGLSMGGYGTWRMAADHPDRFAAVVPVCGGGNPADADKLKELPIWVFHGDQDRPVPFSKSVEMVDAIKAAGSDSIRFTTFEHFGHNCWSATYATPELYTWMRKQRRK